MAWVAAAADAHGPPDLVIANAGLINTPAPLWQVPADEFDAEIDVNVKGVTHVLRAAIPRMLGGGGVLVDGQHGAHGRRVQQCRARRVGN